MSGGKKGLFDSSDALAEALNAGASAHKEKGRSDKAGRIQCNEARRC